MSSRRVWVFAGLLAGACGTQTGPGELFDLTLTGTEDSCHDSLTPHTEQWTYRVAVEGATAQVFIDQGLFATGRVSGCKLTYQSGVFTDERPGGAVRWSVQGQANVALGDSCSAGKGWEGIETLTIVSSGNREVPSGCTYKMSTEGARRAR